jgi:hypothetical protein
MGTRSRIGVMHGDVCKSVYCHWDGYLEHNGRILFEHYDSAKANHLVALGDISSLDIGVEIPEGETHNFQVPLKGVTTFYGRDRGEKGTGYQVDHTFEDFLERANGCGAEFYYIMRDGEWYVGTTYGSDAQLGGKLVPLAEALADEAIDNNELTESVLIKG